MTAVVESGAITPDALTYRPVRDDELAACAEVWRQGINDYVLRLNQPELPTETASLVRLYAHLRSTDPDRFVAALRPDPDAPGGERIVGFAAAVMRERLWYLSMLFVLPEAQGAGVGRALFARVAPTADAATFRATATDSAQPISNALYASLGIVPRVPLLNLIGLPERPDVFGALPGDVRAVPFERIAGTAGASAGRGSAIGGGTTGSADSDGHRRLAETVDALDRELLGVAHPLDHRFLRAEGRRGWLYQAPDGTALGYGYASEAGRVGPVAARDEALIAPILGHLTTEVQARGAFAMWLPGTADRAVVGALQAGFRLDQFPVLLCWDRPFADLARYLPTSPGLL